MWRRRDNWKKRIFSGMLAGLLVATSAMNAMGTIVTHAGQSSDRQKVSYKYDKEQKDIVISVVAENESFAPGEEISLKVYVQNRTDAAVTGGTLSWKGSGLKEAGFPVTEEEEESDPDDPFATVSDAEKATSSDAQSNGTRIWGIQIEAGEIYETEFHGIVDGDEEVLRMRTLAFQFSGSTELEGKKTVKQKAEFIYNTGAAAMLPVEFEENEVEGDVKGELLPGTLITNTNEENIMYVRTRFNIDEIADYLSGPGMETSPAETDTAVKDPDRATDSNAAPAETKAPTMPETTTAAETAENTEAGTTAETTAAESQTAESETTAAETTSADETESASETAEETTEAETLAPDETLPAETTEEETTAQADKEAETETTTVKEEKTEAETEAASAEETKASETTAAEKEEETQETVTKAAEIEKKDMILVQTSLNPADEAPASEETEAEETEAEKTEVSAEETQETEETEKETETETEAKTEAESTTEVKTETEGESEEESGAEAGEETTAGTEAETTAEAAKTETTAAETTAASTINKEEGPEDRKEFTNPKDIRYSVTTYGAELKRVTARYLEEESGDGEMMSEISFRVAEKTRPGLYFGTVNTSVRYDGKEYKYMQGFSFYVVGEGEITLSTEFNGALIEVKGPEECFPEGDVLKLKVTEVPAEKEDMVMEAMEKKADETGMSINKMKALDIKVIADGEEKELQGNVKVTFTDLKLDKVEGSSKKKDEELPEETAALFSRVIKTGESSVEQQTGSTEAEFVEIMHLDEESMELESMSVEVSDDGTIVMDTTHFSIYIVVNFNATEVELIVEHYARFEDWKMVDGIPEEKLSSDKNYVYPGAKSVNGSGVPSFDYKEMKIYADDVHKLPGWVTNGEPYTVDVKQLFKMGNFDAKQVEFITTPSYNPSNYPITNKGNRKNISSYTNKDLNLPLKQGQKNIVRIFYEAPEKAEEKWFSAEFHDYNVTVRNGTDSVKHTGVGINNLALKGEDNKRIHIGHPSDIGGVKNPILDHIPIKDGNTWINVQKGISASKLEKNIIQGMEVYQFALRSGAVDPGLFDRGDIKVNEKYKTSGTGEEQKVVYYAKKYLPEYSLGFEKRGDTYTLRAVKDSNGTSVASNLNRLRYTCHAGHNTAYAKLYSNLFWPMDKGEADNYGSKGETRDPKFPRYSFGAANDEDTAKYDDAQAAFNGTPEFEKYKNIKHNWYFGMRYDIQFSFGDYIGPASYYFRGDDDLWVYINGIRVDSLDVGGIHSAEPAYVDLKNWMVEKGLAKIDSKTGKVLPTSKAGNKDSYTMTVFFIERGGTGSCCFMSYTLPNTNSIELPHSGKEYTTYTATKKWYGDTESTRPNSIQLQLYRNNNPYGNPVTVTKDSTGTQTTGNTWKYTWLSLPAKDEKGKPYKYYAKEVNTPLGYEYSEKADGSTLINTKLDSVTVEKAWTAGTPKEPIKVALYQKVASGQETFVKGSTRELNGTNNYWGYTWMDLPTYDENQKKITYIPYEVTGDNNNPTKKTEGMATGGTDGEKYIVSYDTNNTKVTNTYNYKQITVKKDWKDDNNLFGTRPNSINVKLYRKAGQNGQWTPYRDATLTAANKWSHTWNDIPEKQRAGIDYYYEVREVSGSNEIAANGTITFNGYDYKVTYPNKNGMAGGAALEICNSLIGAKLILRKEIENPNGLLNEPIDPEAYKFIINLKKDNGIYTSVALGHKKTSEVIYLAPGPNGEKFKVEEVVPMEFTCTGMKMQSWNDMNTHTWNDGKGTSATVVNDGAVMVHQGQTVMVTVYNTPKHENYFHHTASITNKKETSKPDSSFTQRDPFAEQNGNVKGNDGNKKKGQQRSASVKVNMLAIVEDKETKQKERMLEEGDVLYG